ncbi:MAG: winged helix-turn-helix transcriptional regulator [Candidatus Brockarchaeota archaeon]|nr:winged helix-turn-helix transcriptional regulator [Candidatus Brockarchaeota archaeon]
MSASQVEDVASSRGRVRILGILVEAKELNATEISRRASLNYSSTLRHLDALKSVGLVSEKNFGRIRIFAYNFQDARAKIFADLFNKLA